MFGIDDAIVAAVAPAVIGGAMDIFGGSKTNQANVDIAQQASAASAAEAQKNRDFQAQQRATQYQTTVEDLQKAGLNPMLAYQQGGAGTPSGAVGQAFQATKTNPYHGVTRNVADTVHSAIGAANVKADLKLKEEQAGATNAQAEAARSASLASLATAIERLAAAPKHDQEIQNLKKQIDVMASQITSNNAAAGLSSAQSGKVKQETDLGIVSSNPITQGWGELKRAFKHATSKENLSRINQIPLWRK